MFTKLIKDGKETPLYYHQTDGGAEYLSDTFIECENGHREGYTTLDSTVVIRIDGGELEFLRG